MSCSSDVAAVIAGGCAGRLLETKMTRQADFKRRVRGRMLKTGESYSVARSHVLAGRGGGGRHGGGRVLHVTNGDMTVPALRETVLGEVMAWRDVLHEGPVPAVPDVELRRIRADFLGGVGAGDVGTLAEFTARDRHPGGVQRR